MFRGDRYVRIVVLTFPPPQPTSASPIIHLAIGLSQGERKLGGSLLATPGEARARLLNDAKKADGGEDGLTGWTLANVGGGGGGDEGGGGGGDEGDADGHGRGGRPEKRK